MEETQMNKQTVIAKRAYHKPVLRVYGQVKQLTQTGGSVPLMDATDLTMRMPSSDRRLKENIVRVGDHPLGIGLYLFDYKAEFRAQWGQGRQFGVMADEVEAVLPQAVSMHPDGYQMVDYGMLGISRTLH